MSWWKEFYEDMDSLNVERVCAWYSDDVELRVGNKPATTGKAAASAALQQAVDQLNCILHDIKIAVTSGDEAFLEFEVHYDFKNGLQVVAPAAAYLLRTAGKIRTVHVFSTFSRPGVDSA